MELIIISILCFINIILARKEALKEGYEKGELDGADKMWSELCKR